MRLSHYSIAKPAVVALSTVLIQANCAQQATASLATDQMSFEIASVRPEESGGMSHFVKIGFEKYGYSARGATLGLLFQEAYAIHDERQIVGLPAWAKTESFSIEARYGDEVASALSTLPPDQIETAQRTMLQRLLEDRFHLALHHEMRKLPIYLLTVVRNGSKLQEPTLGNTYQNGEKWPDGSAIGPHFVSYSSGVGHVRMKGQNASIAQLIDRLTEKAYWLGLDRSIVDNTGLRGLYDFTLKFTVPFPPGSNHIYPQTDSDDSSDLFDALQRQLGLELRPVSGPLDTIVVDHLEPPTEN